MDLTVIKHIIFGAIPSNVNVSDIDIKEGAGKLTVQLSWEVLKASYPDLPKIVTDENPGFRFMDGYCRLIDFNTSIPLVDIEPLSSAYRDKLRSEFDKSEAEGKKLSNQHERKHLDLLLEKVGELVSVIRYGKVIGTAKIRFDSIGGGWTTSDLIQNGDILMNLTGYHYKILSISSNIARKFTYRRTEELECFSKQSILDQEDERIMEVLRLVPMCLRVIEAYPKQVAEYRAGRKGNLGFLLSKVLMDNDLRKCSTKIPDTKLIGEVLERELNIIKPTISSNKSSGKTIKDTDKVIEVSNSVDNKNYVQALRRAGFSVEDVEGMARTNPLRTTLEGKIVTPVDLKESVEPIRRDPIRVDEEQVRKNGMLPVGDQVKSASKNGVFRRKPDGHCLRTVKKTSEVVDDYIAAIGRYEKTFGGTESRPDNLSGKRGVSACSTNKKNITDIEIMLLGNEKFTGPVMNSQKPKPPVVKEEPVKKEIPLEPPPQKTRFKRILSHLSAIKCELKELIRI